MGSAAGFFSFLISSLFTSRCLACGHDLSVRDGCHPSVIPEGWPPVTGEFMKYLRLRSRSGKGYASAVLCPSCWMKMKPRRGCSRYRVEGVPAVSPFRTDEILLKVIRYLKFRNGRAAAGPLSWWMAFALNEYSKRSGLARSEDLTLIPVPLHRSRERKRGYNQSVLLASGVSGMTGIPVLEGILVRVVKTRSQSNLDSEARKKNVLSAFEINRRAVPPAGKVILVDDLVTTGETAGECLRVLRDHGCAVRAVLSAGISL